MTLGVGCGTVARVRKPDTTPAVAVGLSVYNVFRIDRVNLDGSVSFDF